MIEELTWKHVALLALLLGFVTLIAGLATFGGEAGQDAAGAVAMVGIFVGLMVLS